MSGSHINIDVSGRAILGVAGLLSCLCMFYLTTASVNKAPQENTGERTNIRVQDDDAEILDLRLNWIYPPGAGYKEVVDKSQYGQSKFVDYLLKQRENGFFIECGAKNGLHLSNTIFFETKRNWTGLLVEPQLKDFNHLITLHRKAYAINACMSPTKNSGLFAWKMVGKVGGLHESHVFKTAGQTPDGHVQCFPFGAMMAALNVNRVDYFSLDIEGGEVPVLKTIPWNDVYIELIEIEYKYVFFIWFSFSCVVGCLSA